MPVYTGEGAAPDAASIPAELLRKLAHIGSGLIVAALPFFVSLRTIATLAAAFLVGLASGSRQAGLTW